MVLLLEMVRDSVADKVLAEKENAGNRSKTGKSTPLMSPHNILVFLFFLSLFVEKIICKFEDLFFSLEISDMFCVKCMNFYLLGLST